jgi:hypothetical protein
MQGQWLGQWGGDWLGGVTADGNPIVITALSAGGVGSAVMTAQLIGVKPPKQGHGGRGFMAEKPRKKHDDDEVLLLLM